MVSTCPHLVTDLKKNWTLWHRDLFKRSEFFLWDAAFCDPSLFAYGETAHSLLLLWNYQQALLGIHVHTHLSWHTYTTVPPGTMHGNGAAGTWELTSPNQHTAFHNTRPLVWVFWGLRCSRVSPRWFMFASTSCLEIQHVWVVWGLSDLLGCRNSDRKPRWVMICYKSLGEILVFTFIQWKVSHRCRPAA